MFNKTKRSKVYFNNGQVVPFYSLKTIVPSRLFYSALHIQVAHYVAETIGYNDIKHKKLLVNLLATKSEKIKNITSLIWLADNHESQLIKVEIDKQVFAIIRAKKVETPALIIKGCDRIISRKYVANVLVKIFLNVIYSKLLFRKPKKKYTHVIKSYMDEALRFFPYEKKTTFYLVLPFFLSIKRQKSYIKQLKKEGANYTLYGLPYSVRDIASIISCFLKNSGICNDISKIERSAYEKMADQLVDYFGYSFSYNSNDEFENAAFLCGQRLNELSHKIDIKLILHGLGVYCPYIFCKKLVVMNDFQAEFYLKYSNLAAVKEIHAGMKGARSCIEKDEETAIVFIHQNWAQCGCLYESEFQDLLIDKFCELSVHFSRRFFLRLHPNTDKLHLKDINAKLSTSNVSLHADSDLNHYKSIFINYMSAAYYDLSFYGPTIFVDDGSSFPMLFDHGINICSLDQLEKKLEVLLSGDCWSEEYKRNMELICQYSI